jgi:uncharacterized protein (TIGR03083 family)
MSELAGANLDGLYRQTRERLASLISVLPGGELTASVPACPGWTVRDVIAHLTATAQDAVAGRLTGPPDDMYTAGQVARLADVPVPELLARWAAAAPEFEQIIATFLVLPAVVDIASHEQDIRGAVGRPGARGSAAIVACTAELLSGLDVPVPLRVLTEDGEYRVGPAAGDPAAYGASGPPGLTLATSRFEAFRWRMGRRSRSQLAAMNWAGDPAPVLDHLTVFGPASTTVTE